MNPDGSSQRLIDALIAFHNSRISGIVRLERESTKKQLVIENGLIAFAESNVAQEHLARILLGRNQLADADLPRIAALMKSGQAADKAILSCCNLGVHTIEEAAAEQASQILASMLTQGPWEVRIYKGEGLLRRQFDLKFTIPEALVQAARKASSSYRPVRNLQPDLLVRRCSPNPTSLPLDSMEAFAYSVIEDSTSVGDLLKLIPTAAEEVLGRLLILGLVRVERAGSEKGSPHGAAEQIQELLTKYEAANYYEILSLPPDASSSAIKDSYHRLALSYHPDRFQSAEHDPNLKLAAQKLFTFITAAYSTLGNPEMRAQYDQTRITLETQREGTMQGRGAANVQQEKMAETLFRAGQDAIRRKDFEKAIAHWKECVWLRPDVASFRRSLGTAQSEIPKFRKEAEQHLLKAIELDPMSSENHLLLGKLYLKVRLPRKAEQQFLEVLRWDPDNVEAERLLADISKA